MSERMLVATRKGLLTLARDKGGTWSLVRTDFPGIPVTAALHDARDGTLYAVLKHGHFGAKLHRSDDDGKSWQELPAPAFPSDAAGSPTLFQIWTLEAGGADRAGPALGRRAAGRAVPFRRSRRALGAGRARCGMCRSAPSGSAAATTMPASTRSRPIRATPTASSSRSPAAASGTRATAAKAGRCTATA